MFEFGCVCCFGGVLSHVDLNCVGWNNNNNDDDDDDDDGVYE